MSLKTYVLLEHTQSTASVYLRTNANERVRMNKRPNEAAFLQIAFTNPEGLNRVIRLKLNSNTIFQDEQIKNGILANERYTDTERAAVVFRNGVLYTNLKIVQEFLDAHPQNENFKGICTEIQRPLFREYDETAVLKSDNMLFHKRLKAANKVAALNVENGKELLIRLNGQFFKTPDTIEEIQNLLVDYLDEANEEMLDNLIRDEINNIEEVVVLVAKAIGAGVISFDKVVDNVVKVTPDGRLITLKEISSEYDQSERERLFSEYLTTKDGSLILNDIKTQLSKTGDNENKPEMTKEVAKAPEKPKNKRK